MNTRRLAIFAGSAMCLLLAGAASAQGQYDEQMMMARAGEFIVGNGQTKGIAHSKTDQQYRICVDKGSVNVPLKVIHDGKDATVSAGDCADFEAMSLSVSPAGRLPEDFVLVGRYHHLR